MIAAEELQPDVDQLSAVKRLQQLQDALKKTRSTGLFSRFFGADYQAPQGVYMWGGVGRGKSMLMDLFHETLDIERKRRVHFLSFMQDVHAKMRDWRKADPGDPIPKVASEIAEQVRCLAFDEMVVNNSADAMIMSRLFRALIVDEQVTIVTTSN